MSNELRSKFRGALLGVAVGDALGAPFEGLRTVEPADPDAFRIMSAASPMLSAEVFDGVEDLLDYER